MMNDIEQLIYKNINEKEYKNEEIIFLYPNEEKEITTIEILGEELKENILYLLDISLQTNIIFENYEIEDELYQIKIKYI